MDPSSSRSADDDRRRSIITGRLAGHLFQGEVCSKRGTSLTFEIIFKVERSVPDLHTLAYRVYKADVSHSERTTTATATRPPSLTREGRGVVRDDSSSSLSDIRANLLNSNPVMRPRRFMRCNGRGIRVDPKDHVSW
ncbi:hypothetical protein ALC62_06206 [Cyphomyrmex costatus]|uniref:Uncharacterized protein n=1 Tax=Cyphomyrmex costatus TaxID=456900 RepID=A0A195CS28_9HYME|nr:hypothetical protein ALC62_06206 [Cyphomyrmex costatus]